MTGSRQWRGATKQVFAGGTVPTALRLTSSITRPNGTLQLTYEAVGEPTCGNLTDETEDLHHPGDAGRFP